MAKPGKVNVFNSVPFFYKIWADCVRCIKFPDRDENAKIIDL